MGENDLIQWAVERDRAAAAYDGVVDVILNEPCAFKRACFRAGWDAATQAQAAKIDALTLERAAGPYIRTGVFDKDGREICAGDRIRIDLTSNGTKPEYWKPEYEVVFQPPQFTLKHIGGDKDSDTARFYFRVPQPSSTEKIETIYAAPAPEPAHVTAARVLLDHLENDAMTRAVSQEVWDQSCGEWQPSIPGAVEIIAAARKMGLLA